MNAPLRRTAMVCFLLLMSLLVSTTWIQFVTAEELNDHPRNRRTILEQAGRHRGPITAGDLTLADSQKVEDVYTYQRRYPGNKVYSHITGFYTIMPTASELEKLMGDQLTGTSNAQFNKRLADLLQQKEPLGAAVETTIDPRVQQVAWDQLGNRRGAVVALDPQTGAILAMVSKPAYDPNTLAVHNYKAADKAYKDLVAAEHKPLINRAIAGDLYPPGSTFKLVVAAAALESGQFGPDSLLNGSAALELPGTKTKLHNFSKGRPCDPSDQVSLANAIKTSCNTAFGDLAMKLGNDALVKQAKKFGFSDDIRVPMRVTPSVIPASQSPDLLARSGIGQQDVRVTPLQVAMISAAIANNGMLMKPYLVKSVRAADQTLISEEKPKEFTRPTSGQNAALMREMMRKVVMESGGTGKNARIQGVTVAGKSGTANHGTRKEKKPPHNWFTSFAPAGDGEQAKVAVAVVVEEGGKTGGELAAPIAREVMKAVLGQ